MRICLIMCVQHALSSGCTTLSAIDFGESGEASASVRKPLDMQFLKVSRHKAAFAAFAYFRVFLHSFCTLSICALSGIAP